MNNDRAKRPDVAQCTALRLAPRVLEGVEQVCEDVLRLNRGTLCQAPLRPQQQSRPSSHRVASHKNRRARFYSTGAIGDFRGFDLRSPAEGHE